MEGRLKRSRERPVSKIQCYIFTSNRPILPEKEFVVLLDIKNALNTRKCG
jgi:hypothetical protein